MQIYPIAPVDHGRMLGLGDDDHPQYIKDSEFTVNSGFLVGTGNGIFQEETGATARTSLGLGTIATEDIAAIGASILPSDTNTYDLGSSAKVWANIYGNIIEATTITATGTLAGGSISSDTTINGTDPAEWDAAYAHSQIAGGNSVHVSTTENTNWDAAYAHISESGASHSYIDQDVTSGANVSFGDVTIGSGNRIYFAESGVGDTSIKANSTDSLLFETNGNDSSFQMSNSGFIARGAGAGAAGFLLKSPTGNDRYGLKYGSAGNVGDSDDLALTNREAGGAVLIQADNGAGGGGGETTIARFEDDNVKFYGEVLLVAGVAAAGGAPLKFQDGTTLDTPEAGVLNYTGSRFCITNVSTCRVIDRTSNVITETVTVANEDAETVLWTGPMPANSLLAGNVFKFHADGVVSNNGNNPDNDFTIRVRVGGISGDIAASLTPTTKAMTDVHWHVDANATQRTLGGSGSRAIHIHLQVGDADEETALGLVTVDTTANMDVVVTIDWVTAHDNNSISLYQGFMEYKN